VVKRSDSSISSPSRIPVDGSAGFVRKQDSYSLARLEPGRLNDNSCLVCALGVLIQSFAVGISVINGEGGI